MDNIVRVLYYPCPNWRTWEREAMAVTVVLGGQWGDEGKGKLVDILAQDADLVCRAQVKHNSRCRGVMHNHR